jgi:hypothetical protein
MRVVSEKYHMLIHFLMGITLGLFFVKYEDIKFSMGFLFIMGISALIPDLEHLLFFFTYGRHSDYTRNLVKQMKEDGKIKGFYGYCTKNHKSQNSLYFHDGLLPVLFLGIGFFLLDGSKVYQAALAFSLAFHYIYDIFEDYLMLGSLNPNWKRGSKAIRHIASKAVKRR